MPLELCDEMRTPHQTLSWTCGMRQHKSLDQSLARVSSPRHLGRPVVSIIRNDDRSQLIAEGGKRPLGKSDRSSPSSCRVVFIGNTRLQCLLEFIARSCSGSSMSVAQERLRGPSTNLVCAWRSAVESLGDVDAFGSPSRANTSRPQREPAAQARKLAGPTMPGERKQG